MSDLRFALRQALARPLFTALIVGVLALGIGATTAIFSLADIVLFRELPVPQPEQVVRVFRTDEVGTPNNNLNFPAYADLRDNARSFSDIAAYADWTPFNLAAPGQEPARVAGAVVSGGFFEVFDVAPLLGRTLLPSDDLERGAHPVVVLSEQAWRARFGADPGVVGAEIRINTHPFTVVGVMPRGFGGPGAAGSVDAWVTIAMLEQAMPFYPWEYLSNRDVGFLDAVARLAPGVSLAQAQAEVDAIMAGVTEQTGRNPDEMRHRLMPASYAAIDAYGIQGSRRNALLLLGVTLTLLLIAMTNTASLLLVRTEERARELALRLGIGASRTRVLRMLVVEALAYALAGTALGLLLAWFVMSAALPSLQAMLGAGPDDASSLVHARVLAFAAALAVLTAVVGVLSPALRVLRLDLNGSLKQGGAHAPARAALARNAMVVGQVVLSVGLLAVSLLLVRSFWHTAVVDPGFDPRGTLVASVDLLRQGYSPDEALLTQQALVASLERHPAVEAATFARTVPVQSGGMMSSFERPGLPPADGRYADVDLVSPSFFDAMRIPLLQGRALNDADVDGAPHAMVVNRAFADRGFPGEDALGQRLQLLDAEWEVVGVVATTKLRNLREDPRPSVYVSLAQYRDQQSSIIVRGRGEDPWALLPVLREAVHALDPALPVFRARTLAQHVGNSFREARVMAWLLSAFAALAVALSAAGLYGLLSWQVRTRTREIGIRLAIGARAAVIRRQFIRRGLVLTALGIPLGLLAAAWVGRALDALLYGVAPHDPATLAAVAGGFLVLALAASWAPARRSSRVDPMEALRDE